MFIFTVPSRPPFTHFRSSPNIFPLKYSVKTIATVTNQQRQSLGPGLASRQLQCICSFVMSKTTNKRAGVRIREHFVLSAPQFLHMGSSFTVLSMGIL